jgi:hypothetical protein
MRLPTFQLDAFSHLKYTLFGSSNQKLLQMAKEHRRADKRTFSCESKPVIFSFCLANALEKPIRFLSPSSYSV